MGAAAWAGFGSRRSEPGGRGTRSKGSANGMARPTRKPTPASSQMGCSSGRHRVLPAGLEALPPAGPLDCRFARVTNLGYHSAAAPEKPMVNDLDAVHAAAAWHKLRPLADEFIEIPRPAFALPCGRSLSYEI